ncbi:type II secretion system F family protein [Mechercharimyces sp. CAU 1602]|uniref:type II secretion system F family protein n=1 Tax=Mechercharimyces sp. CAU 1602 TaxID=2973933 RepID=UPI002163C73E|nr:type II secretion system F family protein [Mechercharimyces sp. CAU 1602]MCS1350543.1 type II secretion system F family protein [Mechercharimyces sp. CAU 1602]
MLRYRREWSDNKVATFSLHLSDLLKSGFPLLASIRLLAEQKVLSRTEADRICDRLREGEGMAEVLTYERLPSLSLSFLRAAEEHGDFAFGLDQCTTYYRAREKLVRELRQALLYPSVVMIFVVSALFFLLFIVIPRFATLYDSMGVELPIFTQMMLSSYTWIRTGIILISIFFLFSLFCYLTSRFFSPYQRSRWLEVAMRLPWIRFYIQQRMTHYLAIQLGSLLRAGLPLLDALQLMCQFSPWYPLSIRLKKLEQHLLAGYPLHEAIRAVNQHMFLSTLPQMVAIGEQTGKLDESLLTLAKSIATTIQEHSQQLTKSLEPLLIFMIGIWIAFTVITLFLPMLKLIQTI